MLLISMKLYDMAKMFKKPKVIVPWPENSHTSKLKLYSRNLQLPSLLIPSEFRFTVLGFGLGFWVFNPSF